LGNETLLGLLMEHGADVDERDKKQRTPLHSAIFSSDQRGTGALSLLCKHGAQVNARDADGKTPLHQAATLGRAAAARVLLDHGADVNAVDDTGSTPLDAAAMGNGRSMFSLLQGRGGKRKQSSWVTDLFMGGYQGYIKLTNFLDRVRPQKQVPKPDPPVEDA